MISLDTYNSLMEMVHLLRSPANSANLQRSLEQDDAKRRAHRCIEAVQEASRLATIRGWLR